MVLVSHRSILGCLGEPLNARASSDMCLSFYICLGPKRNVPANDICLTQMLTESHKQCKFEFKNSCVLVFLHAVLLCKCRLFDSSTERQPIRDASLKSSFE